MNPLPNPDGSNAGGDFFGTTQGSALTGEFAAGFSTSAATRAYFRNGVVNNTGADTATQETQGEAAIVLGPNGILLSAFNDSSAFVAGTGGANNHFTGWATSADGGVTWADRGNLPNNARGDLGDPVLARGLPFTTGGGQLVPDTIYLVTLGTAPSATATNLGDSLLLFRSTNGGQTFQAPVTVNPGFANTSNVQDKPWIATDNVNGAGQGNVYIAWRNFAPTPAEMGQTYGIRFVRSVDGGTNWPADRGILIAPGGQGAQVVVAPDHSVYVFWWEAVVENQQTVVRISMRRSVDQGQVFGDRVTVATLRRVASNGDLGLTGGSPATAFRSNSFPSAGVNPVTGDLYVAFNDSSLTVGDRADIFLTASGDNGQNWTAPARVNDDTGTNDQFFPTIIVNPNGTQVFVGYYDRRLSATNMDMDVFSRIYTADQNGDLTASLSLRISQQSFPAVFGFDAATNRTYMIGDYNQGTADAEAFHYIWGDTRGASSNAVTPRNQSDIRSVRIPYSITSGETLPDGWATQRINLRNSAFSYFRDAATFVIDAGGGGPAGGVGDNFVHQELSGNGNIVVRVAEGIQPAGSIFAGVSIRETLQDNGRFAKLVLETTALGVVRASFTRRPSAGGAINTTLVNNLSAPYWLRLTRSGNSISAARSPNGVTWTAVGTAITFSALSNTIRIGVAVSGDDSFIRTNSIDNVTVTGPNVISTFAGNGGYSYSGGDGGAATTVAIGMARGVAVDDAGNLFIADRTNHRIRMVDRATGVISTIAGSGSPGYADGPGASAQFSAPNDVAVDFFGNIFVSDTGNHRVRRIDAETRAVLTVGGNGSSGYVAGVGTAIGNGGPATSAQIGNPLGITVDLAGNIYVSQNGYNASGNQVGFVRRIDRTGIITQFAGRTGNYQGEGTNGPALDVTLNYDPADIAVDYLGRVYIAERGAHRVRRVNTSGYMETFAGDGASTISGDTAAAINAGVPNPFGLACDNAGNVYISCEEYSFTAPKDRVRKVSIFDGKIRAVAGTGRGYSGDGGVATAAKLNGPAGLAVDGRGFVFIADESNFRIRVTR